ncbi:sulfatase-like hydrolase/transferase [Carboxylicivirga sediminis]|uniref:Sulfatase-like hydrolase/transferase n=1 Tax=Carboxylicivirga sediminis TaxID=2006564 RepID=A0A941IX00_9BACT|nr:sulfatase-like hydrolase/transferase [Carboxylicivirga sediminis]MBR8535063.1 sulfatase-like hydrolase/transferase [Carboxylicivirga sediminis]
MKLKALKHTTLGLIGLLIPYISILAACADSIVGLKIIIVYTGIIVACIGLLSFIYNKTIYVGLLIIFQTIYNVSAFIDLSYYLIFNTRLTTSALYIMGESNINESWEFLTMYLKPQLIAVLLLFFIGLILGTIITIKYFKRIRLLLNSFYTFKYITIITSFFAICGSVLLRNNFAFYVTTNGMYIFIQEKRMLERLEITSTGNYKDVVHKSSKYQETYVVVIGESTTPTHMGLYGYYRQTNPLLKNKISELKIYTNVRSPHAYTIGSLSKALTLGDYDDPAKMYNSSLIQLFNSAGFYTYFISNQAPIGKYETTVTLTSKISNNSFYTNMERAINKARPDSVIFEPLKMALKAPNDKKFIMVHLMGTHTAYSKRYPEEFNRFTTTPKTQFNHKLAHNTINEYDNAVLYNDYIINHIIDLVNESNSKSFVLYFSDHGEDVYETINEARHAESSATDPMFKVPFIIWQSEKYKRTMTDLCINEERKYNLEDVIFTIADLSNIQFNRFDPQKSIVNSAFKEIGQ